MFGKRKKRIAEQVQKDVKFIEESTETVSEYEREDAPGGQLDEFQTYVKSAKIIEDRARIFTIALKGMDELPIHDKMNPDNVVVNREEMKRVLQEAVDIARIADQMNDTIWGQTVDVE